MRKPKAIMKGLAVSTFLLLAIPCFAQFPVQDTGDHGAMDTLYINCTSPDFFDKDSIAVKFDLMFWTDATLPNEVIVVWNRPLIMTSTNPGASARLIIDECPSGLVYKGTSSGSPNDWEALFNTAGPSSGVLPALVFYGAIIDLISPPLNTGPPLSAGTHILAHIPIIVKDTTTICIDTEFAEIPEYNLFWRNDAVGYKPFWIKKTCCPITPLTCVYKPGDTNGDGRVDLTDLIFIVSYVYKGGPAPFFKCQADLNADGIVTLLDIYYGVLYLFKGGNPPLKSWACCL